MYYPVSIPVNRESQRNEDDEIDEDEDEER
jgi:hypothetical protein